MVEQTIPKTFIKRDAFGFGDILAVDPEGIGAILIQATSDSNHSARMTKICQDTPKAAHLWLSAGNRIQVWSWGLKGAKGKRKLWTLRAQSVFKGLLEVEKVE